jgi:hypothetical protein
MSVKKAFSMRNLPFIAAEIYLRIFCRPEIKALRDSASVKRKPPDNSLRNKKKPAKSKFIKIYSTDPWENISSYEGRPYKLSPHIPAQGYLNPQNRPNYYEITDMG